MASQEQNMLSYTLDNDFVAYLFAKNSFSFTFNFSLRIIFDLFDAITTLFFRLRGYGFEIFDCFMILHDVIKTFSKRKKELNILRSHMQKYELKRYHKRLIILSRSHSLNQIDCSFKVFNFIEN